MTWQKVSAKSTIRTDLPAMSIQKNGHITWNAGMQDALGDPDWVKVMYDPEADRIALAKAERAVDHFQVRKAPGQRTWGFSALGPLKATVGVAPERSYRRYAEEYGEGIWGMGLKELRERNGHKK
jgi:hypothetical protein